MKPATVLALALLAALMTPSVSVDAPVVCTATELAQIAKAADAQDGIIGACERDTGFKLFPFASVPAGDEQQRHVCSGRSCPTAISNLLDAKLPACLVAIGSTRATPAAFLTSLCAA